MDVLKILKKIPGRYILTAVPILASLVFLRGGFYHPETANFEHEYISDTPMLYKLYSQVLYYDDSTFQAREFSYLIDYIDAQAILLSYRLGIIHFYSVSYIILLFVLCSISYYLAKDFYQQKNTPRAIMIVILYLVTPGMFFSNFYFRSSKILTAFFIVVITYLLMYILKKKGFHLIAIVGSIVSGILLSLSDMQGAFYLYAFTLILAVFTLLKFSLKSLVTFLGFLGACIFYSIYRDTIAPQIAEAVIGRRPQAYGTVSDMITIFVEHPERLGLAVKYILIQWSFFMANTGYIISGIIVCAMIWYVIDRFKYQKTDKNLRKILANPDLLPLYLLVISIGMMVIMFNHSKSFVDWPDLQRHYYNVPTATLIMLVLQLLGAYVSRVEKRKKWLNAFQIALVSLIGINILWLPYHYHILVNGANRDWFKYDTPVVRECLHDSTVPILNYQQRMGRYALYSCSILRSAK